VRSAAVVMSLGDDVVRVAILFGAVVLDAIIMVSMAAIFTLRLDMFLHHFFCWLCLPCLGSGIMGVETEGSYRLDDC
jgi:hypothetical protein